MATVNHNQDGLAVEVSEDSGRVFVQFFDHEGKSCALEVSDQLISSWFMASDLIIIRRWRQDMRIAALNASDGGSE